MPICINTGVGDCLLHRDPGRCTATTSAQSSEPPPSTVVAPPRNATKPALWHLVTAKWHKVTVVLSRRGLSQNVPGFLGQRFRRSKTCAVAFPRSLICPKSVAGRSHSCENHGQNNPANSTALKFGTNTPETALHLRKHCPKSNKQDWDRSPGNNALPAKTLSQICTTRFGTAGTVWDTTVSATAGRPLKPCYLLRSPAPRATVAKFGMTSCPVSRMIRGGVAEPGDVDGPLIGTGPPVCIEHRAGLFVTWVPGVDV